MAAAEDYFDSLKQNKYAKKYLDKFELGKSPKNPICNVVPLTTEDFFAPYACNVIVLTGIYKSWDTTSVAEAKQRIIDTYGFFVKYELHIFIDKTATRIKDADSDDLAEMAGQLSTLAGDLSEYGVTYHGQLDEGEMKAAIKTLLATFYGEPPE